MKIFWLDDPEILVTEYKEILPTKSQSTQQQLNALTRLILVVTLILLIIQFDMWYFFFLFAIILVLILAVIIIEVENSENYSDQDKMNTSQTKQKPVKSKKLNPSLSSNTSPVHIYDNLPETTSVFSDTFVDSSAQHGNSAAFDSPRHGGSVGYLSADQSGLSSEQNVEDAKNDAIENHYFRENIRREKLVEGYSRKRENDHRHYFESSGYEPPHIQNQHYMRTESEKPRTYNGYVIL